MKKAGALSWLYVAGVAGGIQAFGNQQKISPNVLFIAIDDLNDWVGCFGGNPQAKTPNIDRLAASGIKFTNAYCDAPACGPSRAALLTGIRPNRSGVYLNNHKSWLRSEVLHAAVQLPKHFHDNGYYTAITGKIHHERWLELIGEDEGWETAWPSRKNVVPDSPWPRHPDGTPPPMRRGPRDKFSDFDWYPLDCELEEMAEVKSASWIKEQLQIEYDRPFFIACGFQKPHVPWFVPRRFFDMHPLDQIQLPEIKFDDLDDVPEIAKRNAYCYSGLYEMLRDNGLEKEAVQAYLAATSYADYCVGLLLDALEDSAYKDNTIIVLWSDHGFHLGEKTRWSKYSLWNEATRCLLMWNAPGITKENMESTIPVNLSDMYPTLVELCGLPNPVQQFDGMSLVPFMKNPALKSEHPAMTAHHYKCYSLRNEEWRYTVYANGTEELYNEISDPLEWTNLARDPEYESVKNSLRKWLPQESAPALKKMNIVSPRKLANGGENE
ncbi:MAG: sulfatase [Kiritimatiellales bacterium]